MGQVIIPLSSLVSGRIKDEWFTLVPQKAGDPVSGELHLRLQLFDKTKSRKKILVRTFTRLW